ncbi:hypothetical protein COXBURSA331_A0911 [Coxiella burnetii RSA 331]|nr:hypothetical protein COXBURSA331_A0911 [Coxiella burnetii RSA 331]EDR36311.1 hypothetical protein COXBURSA334_0957 [Coxiella burnetii Q321]
MGSKCALKAKIKFFGKKNENSLLGQMPFYLPKVFLKKNYF